MPKISSYGDGGAIQAGDSFVIARLGRNWIIKGSIFLAGFPKRVLQIVSSATPTIDTDLYDAVEITALALAITSMTTNLTGTPTNFQTLWISITGTATRAITWGAKFESSTAVLPTTTVGTTRLDIGFVWNTVTSKWRCVAVA